MFSFLETFIYKLYFYYPSMATKKIREIDEIKKEIEEPDFDYIEKFATISNDKKSLLLRIPQEITKHFNIKQGQKIKFRGEFREDKVPELKIELIQDAG